MASLRNMSDEELIGLYEVTAKHKLEYKTRLKKEGDIHLANIFRFFKKWVEKSHPLRSAIKNIVFGVIYGKGAKTLATDIHNEAISTAENAAFELRKEYDSNPTKEKKAALLEKEKEVEAVKANFDHYHEQALSIMEKMGEEWHSLYAWMEKMHESCVEKGYVEAPHGRRRHLRASFLSDRQLHAALLRRAVNAPVQGFGSDVGYMAARLIELHMVKFLKEFDMFEPNNTVIPCGVECAVHDALYQTVPYHLFLPALHIMQWCMTTGVTELFAEKFGDKWLVPPEVETNVSFSGDDEMDWDYTIDGLKACVENAIKGQYAAGYGLPDVSEQEAIKMVFSIPKEQRDYLKENYPFFDDPKHLVEVLNKEPL